MSQFDCWMKNGNHPIREDNSHLIEWLIADNGGKYIHHYKQFCELALELNKNEYNTNPPPTENEFDAAMKKFEKDMRF